MALLSILVSALFLFSPPQSQADVFRQHYEAAEAQRRAGNLVAAQMEYEAVLRASYYTLGRIYSAQAKYDASITVLEFTAARQQASSKVLLDLAIAYFHAQQYQKALATLDKCIGLEPGSAGARQMRGKTYFMLGDFQKSVVELEAALRLAPTDYDVAYTLGLAQLKQRHFAEAQQIYDRLIQQFGNRPPLRVLIGRAYRETGFLPEAIKEFKSAITLDPKFPRVHYYLGLTYLLKDGAGKIDAAKQEFNIELAEHPDEFFANYYLGVISTIERKWDPAAEFLGKASRLQPENPDPYFYLGQAYQAEAKYELAIQAFKKAIELNPNLDHNAYQVTNAHFRLGQCLIKIGKTEEGETELKLAADLKAKAFKQDEAKLRAFTDPLSLSGRDSLPELVAAEGVIAEPPTQAPGAVQALKGEAEFYAKVIANTHNSIALLHAERQHFGKAAEEFSLAAKWNPQQEDVYYNLGLAYYKSELYGDAAPALEKEIRRDPSNLRAKQLLGLSYFMTENYPRASELLSEAVAATPNNATLYYPLALSLSKQSKTEAVNEVVKEMLAKGTNDARIHILLAQAHYEQGASEKALDELQQALALDARVLLAHFYAGMVYIRLGKLADAENEFAAELELNSADYQARYHLAYVLLANQEVDRGLKLMREVIEVKPDFGSAYFELGKALLQKGDIKGALDNLTVAARLEPDQAHVHYQLGRAYMAAGRKAEGEKQMDISKQLKDKVRSQSKSVN